MPRSFVRGGAIQPGSRTPLHWSGAKRVGYLRHRAREMQIASKAKYRHDKAVRTYATTKIAFCVTFGLAICIVAWYGIYLAQSYGNAQGIICSANVTAKCIVAPTEPLEQLFDDVAWVFGVAVTPVNWFIIFFYPAMRTNIADMEQHFVTLNDGCIASAVHVLDSVAPDLLYRYTATVLSSLSFAPAILLAIALVIMKARIASLKKVMDERAVSPAV